MLWVHLNVTATCRYETFSVIVIKILLQLGLALVSGVPLIYFGAGTTTPCKLISVHLYWIASYFGAYETSCHSIFVKVLQLVEYAFAESWKITHKKECRCWLVFWFKNLVAQAKNHSQKPNGGLTHPEPPQLETANRARPTTYVQLLQLRWKFHCYLDSHGNIDVVLYQNNFRVAEALTLTFVIQGEE